MTIDKEREAKILRYHFVEHWGVNTIAAQKVTRLYTYWEAPEAHAVIEFLEVLRDQLWEIYGDQIIDLLREGSVPQRSPVSDCRRHSLPGVHYGASGGF